MGAEFSMSSGPPKETRTPGKAGGGRKAGGILNGNPSPPGMVPSVTEVFFGSSGQGGSSGEVSVSGKAKGSGPAAEFVISGPSGKGKKDVVLDFTGSSAPSGDYGVQVSDKAPGSGDIEIIMGDDEGGKGDLHMEIT